MKDTHEMIYMVHPELLIARKSCRRTSDRNSEERFVAGCVKRKADLKRNLRKMRWWYLAADPVFVAKMEYVKFSEEAEAVIFERRLLREGYHFIK